MPSPQFQKLLDSLGQSSANTEASRDEIIAAYRQQMSDCLVIDGVAPSIAKTTKAEKVLAHPATQAGSYAVGGRVGACRAERVGKADAGSVVQRPPGATTTARAGSA